MAIAATAQDLCYCIETAAAEWAVEDVGVEVAAGIAEDSDRYAAVDSSSPRNIDYTHRFFIHQRRRPVRCCLCLFASSSLSSSASPKDRRRFGETAGRSGRSSRGIRIGKACEVPGEYEVRCRNSSDSMV